jgi:tetratricopeptide (TPR) repeat protein
MAGRDRGDPGPAAILGLLCAAAVAAVYWPALDNGFVWDDWVPLVNSPLFRDPARWLEAISAPPLSDRVAFRPVAMLSFMLQLWAGQDSPGPFHLVNLAIHCASVFLLVLLVRRLLEPDRWALPIAAACGLAYGLHPALTEPVIWISCRYDLLLAFFALLALLADRALPAEGWKRALLAGVAFLCAVCSKEQAVGFLLALPLLHLALDRDLRGSWRVYVALLGVSLVYLAMRYAASGASLGMGRMAEQFADMPSAGQRVLAIVASMAYYVHDAVWPFQGLTPSRALQLPIHAPEVFPVIAASAAVSVVVLLAALGGTDGRALALLFAAFLAALLPVSNLSPLPGRIGQIWASARYLAFPLVLLALALPFAGRVLAQRLAGVFTHARVLLAVLAGLWLIAAAANVRVIIPLWANDGAMNLWAIEQGAGTHWRYANLGEYYMKQNAFREAREAFQKAVALRNDSALHWFNLGEAEAQLGDTRAAEAAFRRSLALDGNVIKSRINIAKLEIGAGHYAAAAQLLEEGEKNLRTADDPSREGVLRYFLGKSYAALGRKNEADAQFKAALALAETPDERATAAAELKALRP